jgi:cell division septation protein DedD
MRSVILAVLVFLSACGINKIEPVKDDMAVPPKPEKPGTGKTADIKNTLLAEDAFIRNIDRNDNAVITIDVVPPERPAAPVPVVYDTLQGFALQLKAFGDEAKAANIIGELGQIEPDSVFYVFEGGLYKVRVGPYLSRQPADAKRSVYRNGSFPGAWVTPHSILKPLAQTAPVVNPVKPEIKPSVDSNIYIQIAAASTRPNAERFVFNKPPVLGFKPQILEQGTAFKIVIGPFKNRGEAEKALSWVKEQYPEAWIYTHR